MAIVAEKHGKRTRYIVRFYDRDGRRRSIRFSGLDKRTAEAIDSRVRQIVSAQQVGEAAPSHIFAWADAISDQVAEKLANAGLLPKRERTHLESFLSGYIEARAETKQPNTLRNWKNTQNKLQTFLGVGTDLRDVGEGDAEDFRLWLEVDRGLAPATVSKAIKHSKQFFAYAVRKRFCSTNPFGHLKPAGEKNDSRQRFIDRQTIAKVLDACPDANWRAIVALSRFGGLRCPSETLDVRIADINWAAGRFSFTDSKTKEPRVVPIFPELEPYLRDAVEVAPDGADRLIQRYRGSGTNLRTQFERIIRRAGVRQWPRLFHNLRATRETELANTFPLHVVCAWIGNSEAVARDHYLQVTEDHFSQAVGVDQGVDLQASATLRNGSQTGPPHCTETSGNTVFPEVFAGVQVPPRGVEPLLPD